MSGFSKFDPNRPVAPAPEGTTPAAGRRAWVLRWATWITWLVTAVGFGFMAYWMVKGN